MPANAIAGFGFFEYYIGDTGSYHRVLVPDILTAIDAGQPVDEPASPRRAPCRLAGQGQAEIELEILAQRQRAIESALRRGREKRAREERERRRREQEAQWRAELEAAIEQQYGPVEAQITEALQAEFGPGFRL